MNEAPPPRPQYTPPVPQAGGGLVPPGWLASAPVSRMILFANIAVFAAQVALTHDLRAVTSIPVRESLLFGANYATATIGAYRLETLITSCFLHGGIIHIALNMLILWQAGPLVERSVGPARMAPMYLLCGLVASLTSALASWFRGRDGYSVGASGAIMGVIAAALVLSWRSHGWRSPMTQSLARWLGLNLILGFAVAQMGAQTDNAAHVGGAVTGAVIALMWTRGFVHSAIARRAILGVCALVAVGSAGVVVWRDVTDPFAAQLGVERAELAEEAANENRCEDAFTALKSVHSLYGDRAEVEVGKDPARKAVMLNLRSLRRGVTRACGPPTGEL